MASVPWSVALTGQMHLFPRHLTGRCYPLASLTSPEHETVPTHRKKCQRTRQTVHCHKDPKRHLLTQEGSPFAVGHKGTRYQGEVSC